LPWFKDRTLTSPYYFTNAKYHNTQCTQFRPTGNSYDLPPIIHSSIAGELPNSSMRCLSRSAQNHTGYKKTFVTSQYFNPPRPLCHTSSQKSQLPSPSECNIFYGRPLGNNNVHCMALLEKLFSVDLYIFCLFYVIFFVIFTSLRIIFLSFLTLPVIDFATTN